MGLTKNIKFATVPNNHDGTSRYVRMIGEPELVSSVNMGVGQGINLTTPLERPQSNFKPSNTLTNERPQQENTYNQDKPDWDTINDKKRKDIKWMNALNNACLIISKSEYTSIELNLKRTEIIELANFIYKLEPKTEPTGEEDFNQPSIEEKINVEDIPFV